MAIDFVDLPINSMVIFPIVMLVHRRVPDIYRGTLNIDANPRDVVFCRHIHLVPQMQRLIYHQFSLKNRLVSPGWRTCTKDCLHWDILLQSQCHRM